MSEKDFNTGKMTGGQRAVPRAADLSAAPGAGAVENSALIFDAGRTRLLRCTDKNVTSVIIPESVRIINPLAFNQCTALKKVVLPSTVQEIGDFAFENCSELSEINFPGGLELIGESAFANCGNLDAITIPASLKKIKKQAFSGCSGITELILPPSSLKICASAFKDCTGLRELILPESPVRIAAGAFASCSALTSVWIPSQVRTSWEKVFPANCRIVREKTPFLKHLYFQLTTLFMALAAAGIITIIATDTYYYGKDEQQITFITITSILFLAGNIIFFRRWQIYPKYLLPLAIALLLSLLSFSPLCEIL